VGGFEILEVSTPAVFAYLRTPADTGDPYVLCVANFSGKSQPAELYLRHHAGKRPVEMLGGVVFPEIGELPYFVTLPPYGFMWFELFEHS
jgi:maltose alpha-D-glucosyltransferase/alpha-amylase